VSSCRRFSAHHELSRSDRLPGDNFDVRFAGSKSWRFEHDDLDVLRRALFVRDAAMLPVAASEEIPPRLTGDVPASSDVVPEGDRAAAAEQWLLWWRLMLDQAVREFGTRKAEDPSDDMMARLQARTSWRHEVCGPPDFAGISAWPELQSAAVGTHSAHHAWALRGSRSSASEDRLFAWQVVNDAVHDAAASLGMPVSEMDAVAHVVPVKGEWSYIAGPGCGVCSVDLALDPVAAGDLLRKLFVSAFPGTA
jgi:hypothetical protein